MEQRLSLGTKVLIKGNQDGCDFNNTGVIAGWADKNTSYIYLIKFDNPELFFHHNFTAVIEEHRPENNILLDRSKSLYFYVHDKIVTPVLDFNLEELV